MFKTIEEAQKTSVVREMMPKDIKREFLTGPRKFDEIMGKLEIIVMDLVKVGTHDIEMTQSDSDTSNDMPYDDVGAIDWKGHKAGKGTGKKGPNGSGTWHRGKGAHEWTSGRRDDGGKKGGKKGSKGSKPDWYSDRDTGGKASQGLGKRKGKGKGKSETRCCYDYGEQGFFGVSCPHKWTNSIDDQDDQDSSWESEPEGERAEELASMEAPDDEGEC